MDNMSDYTNVTYDLDEREAFRENILSSLRSGRLLVKNKAGGSVATFRCPFCTKRKTQCFLYKDILQHAEAMARSSTKGTTEQTEHVALVSYLKTDLAQMSSPPPFRAPQMQLTTKAPEREELIAQDLLLCPWSMVIHNLQTTVSVEGIIVGPSVRDVKCSFETFGPKKVHVIWGPKGHAGIGVITFSRDFNGWRNAQAFERWFRDRQHGRNDWQKIRDCNLPKDAEPYGWLARKEDYYGRNEVKDDHLVAKFLQSRGPLDLKDIGMIGDDLKNMHEQRYQHLAEELLEKTSDFHHLLEEVELTKRSAESMIARLEEKHKQELDQNQRKLDVVNQQAEIQKKHQAFQMALIRKHEMENEHLAEWIQFKKMSLAKKHLMELENQRLDEMRESKKFLQLAHSIEDPEYLSDKGVMNLEEKIDLIEKQKAELIEELEELKVDNDAHNETIMALARRERLANDEVQEARQAAELAIGEIGTPSTLYIRKMGEIDEGPWREACQQRYENHKDGWETVFRKKYSRWEETVRNPSFAPFKYASVGGNSERQIQFDYSDKKLLKLQETLGDEVVRTVVRALEEIEEFNSCGRYPVPRIWNAKEGRIATLKEVIRHLHCLLKQTKRKKRSRSNANAHSAQAAPSLLPMQTNDPF
ncbi:hypothetical protein AXG93_2018s1620 [Marchantia polymorpha subsp. ruderalis]|uniref:XS domain-containing protein n=1 Tax=Marchantia polymorpha subsp. ruderalis TaxID=1480154 RepID=A0A176WFE0_MARPO|nr:hypothetical protein AXG93_2018s1620 [Marchantia polymorpha subsp. ruderalis]